MTWQPINSAPTDGTYVLLGWYQQPAEYMEIGAWQGFHPNAPGLATWRTSNDGRRLNHPTHWMPLPEAP